MDQTCLASKYTLPLSPRTLSSDSLRSHSLLLTPYSLLPAPTPPLPLSAYALLVTADCPDCQTQQIERSHRRMEESLERIKNKIGDFSKSIPNQKSLPCG